MKYQVKFSDIKNKHLAKKLLDLEYANLVKDIIQIELRSLQSLLGFSPWIDDYVL